MSGNVEAAGRSMADLQQLQVQIDPATKDLLASYMNKVLKAAAGPGQNCEVHENEQVLTLNC